MDRSKEVINRVKEASDLVTVIERYLPLRRAGRNLVGLCPFHQEKTPSFTVYPDSQHFKCYGCGKVGDVFDFVREREGLEFRDALELLAQRAGVSTEGFGAPGDRRPRIDAPRVLGDVKAFFQQVLQSEQGGRARRYLEDRGLADGIEPFGLGAHPEEAGALMRFARDRSLPREVLEQAGLIARGREVFRGRLMFPIEDARGRVVGFGGRDLTGESRAKYRNSPESPFFLKRRVLYGLRHAKDAGQRRIVVVEGYTDVIACHLAGFHGAVATLGTALTPDHGRELRRYADEVVVLFDGDRAGRAAAEKAYGELVKTELPLRVALLDEGCDPADLLSFRPGLGDEQRAQGLERFETIVAGADDALTMWFRLKRARYDLTSDHGVVQAVEDCAAVLDGLDDPVRGAMLASHMARHLGLDEATFQRSLKRRGRRAARRADPAAEAPAPEENLSPLAAADLDLMACVLSRPPLADRASEERCELEEVQELLASAREAVAEGAGSPSELLKHLFTRCSGRPRAAELLARSADMAASIRDPHESFALLLRQRRTFCARQTAQRLRLELQQAAALGDRAKVEELTRRYVTELQQPDAI